MGKRHHAPLREGNYVRIKGGRSIVRIDKACDGRYAVHGKREFFAIYTDGDGLEQLDAKTAFLTELKELLEKYDARIFGGNDELRHDDFITILVGDDAMRYSSEELEYYAIVKPDNIMDYEKG